MERLDQGHLPPKLLKLLKLMALDLKNFFVTRFARSRQLLPLQQGKPLLGK
jgi:hypothetical protein